jgi:hypothetical protein
MISNEGLGHIMPEPVLFNPWKHHQDYIIDQIRRFADPDELPLLSQHLNKIGESTTDLYIGTLGLEDIADLTLAKLEKMNLNSEESYLHWIRRSKGSYRTETFPDGSVWVFRTGYDERRYVHIHPGRNVPFTLRVKANVLKTAISVNARTLAEGGNPLDIIKINEVRRGFIGLDPIKFTSLNHELGRMIYHFAVKIGNLT